MVFGMPTKNQAAVKLGAKGGKASAGKPKTYSAEELGIRARRLEQYREDKRIEALEAKVWIYGFYDSNGRAVYVGRTIWPEKREQQHRSGKRGKGVKLADGVKGCVFRRLRSTDHVNAARIEAQVIAAYRIRGQCELNSYRGNQSTYTTMGTRIVSDDGRVFASVLVAALAYDCSPQTIYNAINRHKGVILADGKTVRLTMPDREAERSKLIEQIHREINEQKGKT